MTVDQAVDLVRDSLLLMLLISAPILSAGLIVGLAISVFQAVTQIQEQTLTFVPKIVIMALITIMLTPWMANLLLDFSARMFGGGP